MIVDSTLKLTWNDWIKEQMDTTDINRVTQLLKTNRLSKYVAQEMDFSGIRVVLKYRKNLFLNNGLLYWKVTLKNHLEPVTQFVLPKRFIHKVILVCHDGENFRTVAGEIHLAKNGRRCAYTYTYL